MSCAFFRLMVIVGLLCCAIPLFSMQRVQKIVGQMQEKPEHRKDIFDAVRWGGLDSVKYWVNRGVDVNIKNKHGEPLFMIAAMSGDLDIIKYLIDQGVDKDAKDSEGHTALMRAAQSIRYTLNAVTYLIEQGAAMKDGFARALLASAVKANKLKLIQALEGRGFLAENFDPNSYSDGKTLLILSLSDNDSKLVEFLIKKGANPYKEDESGLNAFDYAKNDPEILAILNQTAHKSPEKKEISEADRERTGDIFDAVEKRSVRAVKYWLHQGVDIETKNYLDETVLAKAAKQGVLDIVKYLVDQGANKEAKDRSSKKTPLLVAAESGKLDVVQYLIEQGADKQAKDEFKETLLFAAIKSGKLDVVKYVIGQGADEEAKGHIKRTPLIAAAESGTLDIVKYLVERGADKNAKDGLEQTSLLVAAESGKLDIVKYLVEQGVDKEARNYTKRTPLAAAANLLRLNVVKYLVELGADKEAKDSKGWTPLMMVADVRWSGFGSEQLNLVKYLIEAGAIVDDSIMVALIKLAAQLKNKTILSFLTDKGYDLANPILLSKSIIDGNVQNVELLLEIGINPYQEDDAGLNAFDYAQDNPQILTLLNKTKHAAHAKKEPVVEPESDTTKAIRRLQHIKRAMQLEPPKAAEEETKAIAAQVPVLTGLTQTEAHWKQFGTEIEKEYGKVLDDPLVKRILAREKEAVAQGKYVFYRSEPGKYRVYEYFIEQLYRLVNLYSAKNEFVWNRFFKDAAKEETINEYISPDNAQVHKTGPEFNVLLSANIGLFGNVKNSGSCTWHYFLKNYEATGKVELSNIFKRIFDQYGFDVKYIGQLLDLSQGDLEKAATLQQIIIPKNIVDDVAMFAGHGYCFPWQNQVDAGQADSCWDPNAISVDLKGNPRKGRYTCISSIIDKYRDERIAIDDNMQVRILMNAVYGLNPESGIKIYQYTRFPEKKLQHFKKQVQKITDEMFGEWLKEQLQKKEVPESVKGEKLGDVLQHLGKGKVKSKL